MATAPEKLLTWLIVEDGLKGLHGHFLDFVRAFVRELTCLGDKVVVFSAKGSSSEVVDHTAAMPVLPGAHLREGSLKSISSMLNNGAWIAGTLLALLKHRSTVDHSDVVFVPTTRVQHLVVWRLYLACRGSRFKGTLLFFFMTTPVRKRQAGAGYELEGPMGKAFARLIDSLTSGAHRGQIRLATETKELSATLSELCAANFEVIPQPVEAPTARPLRTRKTDDPVVVGSFGPPRDEKGSHLLVEAIRNFLAKTQRADVRFTLQWTSGFVCPDGVSRSVPKELRDSADVHLIERYFKPGEYESVLSETDAIVLPYGETYELRGSRVLIDALVRGLPVAVTKGTSLETLAREYGRCVLIEDFSPAAVEKALHELVRIARDTTSFEPAPGDSARRYFSVKKFRELLVKNKTSSLTTSEPNMLKEFVSSLLLYICNYWIAFVPFYAVRLWYYRTFMGFRIGKGSSILMGARFRRLNRITIGENCAIHENCVFSNLDEITIKDCVVIGPQCYLHTTDHDVQDPSFPVRMEPITIGNHAFIGLQSTVLKGVNIGENAVVGAKSLVTKPVEPSAIVVGAPARPIGRRKSASSYTPEYWPLFR